MRWSQVLNVVDVHCGGENARVVTGGVGDVPGETMFDKRAYLTEHRDDLRLRLLQEPRGGVIHSADFVLPSRHPEAQLGYVIAESTEYPVMSGSNTICVTTALLETGMLPMVEPVTHLDARVRRRPDPGRVHLRRRQGHLRPVHQPARVRLPPRRPGRGPRPRHRHRRRRLGRDGVRAGRRRVARLRHHARRGPRPLRRRRGDQARRGRAAGRRAPRAPRVPGHHELRVDRTARPRRRRRRSPRSTPWSSAPAGSTGHRAAPAPRPGSPSCTRAASSASGENFVHTSIIGSRFDSRIESLTTVGDVPGRRAERRRPGVDHPALPGRGRPERPVPERLRPRRHLGRGTTVRRCAVRLGSARPPKGPGGELR